MIEPTIGRQVWFWATHGAAQPQAATVCFVHHNRLVNLQVIDHTGSARPAANVTLRQPEDSIPFGEFAEWMPFQKGQAAKTEQLERAGAAAVGVA